MEKVKAKAPAKINLSLDITGRRPDGYHEVRMLMQTISLSDEITVSREEGLDEDILEIRGGDLPVSPSNLCLRAAEAMRSTFSLKGHYRICLLKRIPLAAGLAGGSADASSVMQAIARLEGLPQVDETQERIKEAGARIGADIPYCLHGGFMLSEGIGEILTPLPDLPALPVLLIKPPYGISTPEAYRAYDSLPRVDHPDTDRLLKVLKEVPFSRALREFEEVGGNVLMEAALLSRPEIGDIAAELKRDKALLSLMTGSGPTVFGIFSDEDDMERAARRAGDAYPGYTLIRTRILPGKTRR